MVQYRSVFVCSSHSLARADIIAALKHRLDAKWRYFGTFLGVEYQVMECIHRDRLSISEDCMLELVSKWTSEQEGTGTLPRTWQTVVEAVQLSVDKALAQDLAGRRKGRSSPNPSPSV